MRTCPRCGRENADDVRFCGDCGLDLDVAAAQAPREERKVVTVVFADLVGSTARAERLDPEDVRAILAPFHERLRHELERHGGTVEKFIGDAVVAVFGAPVAHEDDPERAVRAALAIQEAISEMNEADRALELEVRVGVATGEALVALDARPELGEGMVSGDVMNTGARLQSAAPPGGVLVGETTYRATARAIDYEDHDPVTAKGKTEPLPAWLAVARRASFGIDLGEGLRAPLVGRTEELDVLVAALSRVRTRLEPQLVTLVGVPGIGKSRLVQELMRLVEEDSELITWRQGRSLPYGEGVALWALGEIVKAQAGVLETDAAAEVAGKLSATLGDLIRDEADVRWVERHLRPLAGIHDGSPVGEAALEEAFAAWRRFLEALAEVRPTVLVFEDLHWADDVLLDFVDSLAERVAGVPLLVVCSARPELLERRPGWGGGKRNATTVSLDPLSDDDTARLLGALLDRSLLPAETQLELLRRAGGIPLFAEEYARMQQTGGPELEVPETLQGIVAARIDALPPTEKTLLQAAAVLGKVFWTDALHQISGIGAGPLDDVLFALERKEFVRRERRSVVAAARQLAFVHALVRDAAYGQVPRAERARLHRRAAEWIEELPPDRAEDRAEMLAHHLLQAVEYGRAAGLDVTALLPKAAQAVRDAGDRASALGSPHAALAFYEHSRALDPSRVEDPYLLLRIGRAMVEVHGKGEDELERAAAALAESDPAAAAEAEVSRGEIVWQRGDRDGSFPYFERAAAAVQHLPHSHQKLYVVCQVARFLALAGRSREGLRLSEEALAMAEELENDDLRIDALNTHGLARVALGDHAGIGDIERSLALALESNSWRASRAYLNLGSEYLSMVGDVARAETAYREGLRYAERRGARLSLRWYGGNLAEATFHRGLWEEALRLAEREIDDPEPHYMQQLCRIVRAHMRLARGDKPGALEDAALAAANARAIRDPQALIPGLAARAFVAGSDDARAIDVALGELNEALHDVGPEAGLAGPWVVELAFTLLELGREPELLERKQELGPQTPWRDAAFAIARGDLVGAAHVLGATGSAAFEAHAQLRLAQRLSAHGRHSQALEHVAHALSFYRGVGATAAVREGEALLAAAS